MPSATETAGCPYCGSPTPYDARFCPKCGRQLKRFCHHCGLETRGHVQNFCQRCGGRLDAPPSPKKYCVHCGSVVPYRAAYCPSCGGKFVTFAGGPPEATGLEHSSAALNLDERVYNYILDREGAISWSQASKDLKLPIQALKDAVQRLKQAGKLE